MRSKIAILAVLMAVFLLVGANANGPVNVRAASTTPTVVKLTVEAEGIYRVTYGFLEAHGIQPSTLSLSHLQLSDSQGLVPLYLHRGAPSDSTFGPSDYVEFYGHPINNTYTTINAYMLEDVPGNGSQVTTVTSSVPSVTSSVGLASYTDQQRSLRSAPVSGIPNDTTNAAFPSAGDQNWKEADLLVGFGGIEGACPSSTVSSSSDSASCAVRFQLTNPVNGGTCSIRAPVEGYTDSASAPTPAHELTLAVNGHTVSVAKSSNGSFIWHSPSGQPAAVAVDTGTFPCSDLVPSNQLTYTSTLQPGVFQDEVLPQSFSISYRERLCATHNQVEWIGSGGKFAVGGFSSATEEVWRIQGPSTEVMAGMKAVSGGACAPGSHGVAFDDPGTGTARYVATNAPLTPMTASRVDPGPLTVGAPKSAQYLIIANPALAGAVGPLVALHRSQGMTVRTVTVTSIYDQYRGATGTFVAPGAAGRPGDGYVDPLAIRAYVAYAHSHFGTRYVLLVGGDTFDYHNFFKCPSSGICGSANPDNLSLMPSLYVNSTYSGLVASDNEYAVPPTSSTDAPDLAIGRLPALSVTQLRTEVNRTVNFHSWLPAYKSRAVFTAGYGSSSSYCGQTGDPTFADTSTQMAAALPKGFSVSAYYDNGDTSHDDAIKQDLMKSWDAGQEIVNFTGHGNLTEWSSCGGILKAPDVSLLTNSDKPALVFQWGCQATDYLDPRAASNLDLQLLNAVDSKGNPTGAVLTLGSSGEDLAVPQATLAGGTSELTPDGTPYFYGYLAKGDSVGTALELAKDGMVKLHGSDGDYMDVVRSYNILGDPALTLNG
ncbi:MAG TPA: C25 family cysteine peptidase [Chloroflexota bacterium]|nr:C25 family cysteine peptidase [Chloroflexota bacterium]